MKIFCIGRNYTDHIEELNNESPAEPVIFLKPETAILNESQGFYIPDFSENIQYEVELLVKINRMGKYIQPKFAYKYYNQIGLGIDFTARDLQQSLKEKGLPWEKSKAFDGSALVGKKWIDVKEFEDLQKIKFSLLKNGQKVQQGHSAQMIWKINELIAEISKFFTLKVGDIIFTGTPAGVGKLERGDKLEGFIEEISIFKVDIK